MDKRPPQPKQVLSWPWYWAWDSVFSNPPRWRRARIYY